MPVAASRWLPKKSKIWRARPQKPRARSARTSPTCSARHRRVRGSDPKDHRSDDRAYKRNRDFHILGCRASGRGDKKHRRSESRAAAGGTLEVADNIEHVAKNAQETGATSGLMLKSARDLSGSKQPPQEKTRLRNFWIKRSSGLIPTGSKPRGFLLRMDVARRGHAAAASGKVHAK